MKHYVFIKLQQNKQIQRLRMLVQAPLLLKRGK